MPDASPDSLTPLCYTRVRVETYQLNPLLKKVIKLILSHTASHLYTLIGNKTIEVNLIYDYRLLVRLTGCKFASTIIV